MGIPKELLDELMKNYKNPEDLIGENGLLKELTKALVERALEGEITDHLGFDKHSPAGDNSGNTRNGHSSKILKTPKGEVKIEVPRDRKGKFLPRIVAKNQTHFAVSYTHLDVYKRQGYVNTAGAHSIPLLDSKGSE